MTTSFAERLINDTNPEWWINPDLWINGGGFMRPTEDEAIARVFSAARAARHQQKETAAHQVRTVSVSTAVVTHSTAHLEALAHTHSTTGEIVHSSLFVTDENGELVTEFRAWTPQGERRIFPAVTWHVYHADPARDPRLWNKAGEGRRFMRGRCWKDGKQVLVKGAA